MKLSKTLAAPNVCSFGLFFALLGLVLSVLFAPSFDASKVHFSNDNPLGMLNAQWLSLPQSFRGAWYDINWLGFNEGSSILIPSNLWRMVVGAVYYSKFYVPLTLLFFGCCAWLFFRSLGYAPSACALGGFAAALGANFFSLSCWGVGTQVVAFGFDFLALAAVVTASAGGHRGFKLALAGLAVGMGVMEGVDNGAIFSLFVAAFILFRALTGIGSLSQRLAQGIARVALVAVFAAFIAAQSLTVLIGTQIQGVAGTGQDSRTKQEKWDWATQWSLPKTEALGLIIPGLFGYRMDTPGGGNYWGALGRDPAWDKYLKDLKEGRQDPQPSGYMRFSGAGIYAGVGVVLIGLWAVLQSFRRQDSVFTLAERRFLWFWSVAALLSLLLAFGRHAPFYQFFYAFPYFSTIRNPAKFTSVFNWALLILFASGVHGLQRRYLGAAAAKTSRFDNRWIAGCGMAVLVGLLSWWMYSHYRASLEQYLETVALGGPIAAAIAEFSIQRVGWFVLFLVLAAGLVAAILGGAFAGNRAKWGTVLLGSLVIADLARANKPSLSSESSGWVIFWDYKQKYATDPVIDFLRAKPSEQRVAILPFRPPPQFADFYELYRIEWAQQLFPYYNIQSLDLIQLPRAPVDYVAYEGALAYDNTPANLYRIARRWQLTNTRYLLGPAGFLNVLNQQIDPALHRFRIIATFDVVPKAGITTPTMPEQKTILVKPDGTEALFEFTGALPRAKLYPNWQVSTNDQATLERLASPTFDPEQTVLVADPLPPSPANSAGQQATGSVTFASYAPTRIVLRTKAQAPEVLLLNDKFDSQWNVSVDGKPAALLRCNYIMRGVQVPAGDHKLEFRFAPPINSIYVSLAAMLLGLGLLGFLAFASSPEEPTSLPSSPAPAERESEPVRARSH